MDELRIDVATPCSARWEDMTGTERKRLCALCNRHVYELSGLSSEEIQTLVADEANPPCVRFFRRADGTVLTADCPVGLAVRAKQVARRAWPGVAAAVAGCLAAIGLTEFGAKDAPRPGPSAVARVDPPKPPPSPGPPAVTPPAIPPLPDAPRTGVPKYHGVMGRVATIRVMNPSKPTDP